MVDILSLSDKTVGKSLRCVLLKDLVLVKIKTAGVLLFCEYFLNTSTEITKRNLSMYNVINIICPHTGGYYASVQDF